MVTTRNREKALSVAAKPQVQEQQSLEKEKEKEEDSVVVVAQKSPLGERVKDAVKETCDNLVMGLTPMKETTEKVATTESGATSLERLVSGLNGESKSTSVLTFKETLALLPKANLQEVAQRVKDLATEVCEKPNAMRSQKLVTTLTNLAKLSRELIKQKASSEDNNREESWLIDLHEAATAMHNKVLLASPSSDMAEDETDRVADITQVQECENAVACLCETLVYEKGAEAGAGAGHHHVCHVVAARTLPWLLVQSLTRTDQPAWSKRAVRFALETVSFFDWCDESALSLKRLFLRSLFCPPFVRTAQGRKMLARCFTLDPEFSQEMMAVIKNQLLAGRHSLAEHYGEILFVAWKQLSPSTNKSSAGTSGAHDDLMQSRLAVEARCLLVLENELIPSLVRSCLHARTLKLSDMLRRLLRSMLYQNRRKLIACEEVILKTHEPLLFRALASCNAQVRRNACALITECFPLTHTRDTTTTTSSSSNTTALSKNKNNHSVVEWKQLNERILAKQLEVFGDLLRDNSFEVRALAATSTAHVLKDHWDSLPAVDVVKLVNLIVDLTHDASSVAVRTKALQALLMLTDCIHAQDALRKTLPSVLSARVHDPSRTVRLQCLKILLQLHLHVRSIVPFYEAVQVTQLLELLAKDKEQEVKLRVTQLLLSSYIPSVEEGASFVMALLQQQPQAGKSFCMYARQAGCEPSTVSRILYELVTHLIYASSPATQKKKSKKRRGQQRDNEEEEGAPTSPSDALEKQTWCHVMQGISNLAESLLPESDDDDAETLFDLLSKLDKEHHGCVLHTLYELAPSKEAKSILIGLASRFPAEQCSALVDRCRDLCLGSSESEEGLQKMEKEVAASLRALCLWGFGGDLIHLFLMYLKPTLSSKHGKSNDIDTATGAAGGGGGVTPLAKRMCRRTIQGSGDNTFALQSGLLEYLACVLSDQDARQELLREEQMCETLINSLKAFVTEFVLTDTASPASLSSPNLEENQSITKRCVMVLCKLALHYSEATGRKEIAGGVLRDLSKQILVYMDHLVAQEEQGEPTTSKMAFLPTIEALTALSNDALLLNTFTELADIQETLTFARRVNEFAMTISRGGATEVEEGAPEGAVLKGFEYQMKRLVSLLLSTYRTKEKTCHRSQAVLDKCDSNLHGGTLPDFEKVFQTLSDEGFLVTTC